MKAITIISLVMIIALAIVEILMINQIKSQQRLIKKNWNDLHGLAKAQAESGKNIVETWNHAERALIRAKNNERRIADLNEAIRKLQGWPSGTRENSSD